MVAATAREDRLNRACVRHHGNAVLVFAVGGGQVSGIFDAAYADPLGMENTRPRLLCAAADVPSGAVGQTASIGAEAFTVRAIEPDGTGMAALILERV